MGSESGIRGTRRQSASCFRLLCSTLPAVLICAVLSGCGGGGSSDSGNGNGGNCLGTEPGFCGTLTGLPAGKTVTLNFSTSDAGGGNLTLDANGPFKFVLGTQVDLTTTWDVTVTATAPGASCNVTDSGNNVGSDGLEIQEITGVAVSCANAPEYTIGGTLSGLDGGTRVTLEDNGGDPLTLTADGAFAFPSALAPGSAYSVTVGSQPTAQLCAVNQGSGSNVTANVTSVVVTCSLAYTVGGTLSGLKSQGTITLENNGGDSLTLAADGAFTFPTAVAPGGTYDVTETSEPVGQDCSVTGGSGSASSDITGVQVTCVTIEQLLYTFGGEIGDAALPYAGLLMDGAGNLYGTSKSGGSENCVGGCGTVFELTPDSSGGYTESVLYAFTAGSDGASPEAGLIMDHSGDIYGTTAAGGQVGCVTGCGTVFKLAPDGTGSYTESILHAFTDGSDGANPEAGLIMDGAGNLYGTAMSGGIGDGVVFELVPNGSGGYSESVLYDFAGNATGEMNPNAPLLMDSAGNLYGMTAVGGGYSYQSGCGSVFRLAPDGSGGYTETDLYTFGSCSFSEVGPDAGVIMDSVGDLFGTKFETSSVVVFELTPNGSGGYIESDLDTFPGGPPPGGGQPYGGVIRDSAGNLYGTTYDGGSVNYGSVFKLTPNSSGGYTESILYNFAGANIDGANPSGALIMDSSGHLYGTTVSGGAAAGNSGTVFEIFPQ